MPENEKPPDCPVDSYSSAPHRESDRGLVDWFWDHSCEWSKGRALYRLPEHFHLHRSCGRRGYDVSWHYCKTSMLFSDDRNAKSVEFIALIHALTH